MTCVGSISIKIYRETARFYLELQNEENLQNTASGWKICLFENINFEGDSNEQEDALMAFDVLRANICKDTTSGAVKSNHRLKFANLLKKLQTDD